MPHLCLKGVAPAGRDLAVAARPADLWAGPAAEDAGQADGVAGGEDQERLRRLYHVRFHCRLRKIDLKVLKSVRYFVVVSGLETGAGNSNEKFAFSLAEVLPDESNK